MSKSHSCFSFHSFDVGLERSECVRLSLSFIDVQLELIYNKINMKKIKLTSVNDININDEV